MGNKDLSSALEVAELLIPDSMEFPTTPLRSAESMRQAAREELANVLLLQDFRGMVDVGLSALNQYASSELSHGEKEEFEADLHAFGERIRNAEIVNQDAVAVADIFGLSKKSMELMDRIGEYFCMKKEYELAAGVYTMLVMFDHADPGLWCRKAIALQGCKKWEEALGCFDAAAEFAPENPGPWVLKAGACKEMGNEAEATRCLEKAKRLMEQNPDSKKIWEAFL